MSIYMYRAKSLNGKETKGKIEANSEQHLLSQLREKHLYPLSYKKESALNKDLDLSFMQKVGLKELTIFTRQFAAMITAGLTVVTALDIIKTQSQNKKLKDSLEKIADDVKKGSSLSESMAKFPKIYPEILINMINAGELSGKLDVSLDNASDHFDKESAMAGKVKGAMTYPLVVCVVALVAIAFLIAFVIPGFMSVFEQLGSDLPSTTKALIALSDAFRNFWYVFIIGIAGLIIAFNVYYKTPGGHELIDRLKLKLPVFGVINIKVAASRFSRTLATMMEAGLPLLMALEITGKVIDNYYIQKIILKVRDEVSRGSGLSLPLMEADIFPPMVTHMVAVGEQTGEMETLLKKSAVFFDDEVDLAVKQLTTALEPMILIVLGGAVMFIVLSILQPMFAMYQGASNL